MSREIQRAAELLRAGHLVAFPTETVYGLGADALNAKAVAEIFMLKGRPADVPLTIHLGSAADPQIWAVVSPSAKKLMDQFWPGPLTLILPKTERVPPIVVANGDTVGLRMPAHPLCNALLNTFGGGVAAPSANRHRSPSPTSAQHVRDDFGDSIPMILDGGECTIGLESTVLWMAGPNPQILRHGAITREALESALGTPISGPDAPARSYTLQANMHLAPRTAWPNLLAEAKRAAIVSSLPIGTLNATWIPMPSDPLPYQQRLFSTLRTLEEKDYDIILIEPVPDRPEWYAIRDRLNRAT